MDIFEFALEKEKYSLDYYNQLKDKTNNKGLSSIFSMLADEEKKHVEIVKQMQQQTPQTVTETNVLGNATAIFEKMRESMQSFDDDLGEVELYEKARDIEKKARQFYLEKAEVVTNASHREIFQKLAAEEQKHFVLLERICDFVARPKWFLENAEMYRFDDYADGVL
jgi:rubrerythrin